MVPYQLIYAGARKNEMKFNENLKKTNKQKKKVKKIQNPKWSEDSPHTVVGGLSRSTHPFGDALVSFRDEPRVPRVPRAMTSPHAAPKKKWHGGEGLIEHSLKQQRPAMARTRTRSVGGVGPTGSRGARILLTCRDGKNLAKAKKVDPVYQKSSSKELQVKKLNVAF